MVAFFSLYMLSCYFSGCASVFSDQNTTGKAALALPFPDFKHAYMNGMESNCLMLYLNRQSTYKYFIISLEIIEIHVCWVVACAARNRNRITIIVLILCVFCSSHATHGTDAKTMMMIGRIE